MKNALFILCLFLFPLEMVAQFENYKMDWTKISNESQYNSEPEWLKDAKFGIYFHWGVYSVPAYSLYVNYNHSIVDYHTDYLYSNGIRHRNKLYSAHGGLCHIT